MNHLKTFENISSSIKTVNYVTTHDLGSTANKWMNDNPHSNGFAYEWIILDPNESAYPEMENYFLDNGLEIEDTVIVHSFW